MGLVIVFFGYSHDQLSESSSAKSSLQCPQNRAAASLQISSTSAASLQNCPPATPPFAPQTADRDEPAGGIISVATPDSAPPLVPLQSEHERLLQHRPAITTLNHPLARRHGPTAAHARAVPHHPPIPRRASRDMPTTRAPAGPRRRRAARGGGRAMHLTPSPTTEITAVAPWADHERAAWRRGRAPPALRRADGASTDRPRPCGLSSR